MKQNNLLLQVWITLVLAGCVGADEVQDTISSINILPPENVTLVNDGNFAKVLGQEALLLVEAKSDLGGSFIATPENLTWASSDEAVATISEEGMVSAVGVGNATISVIFMSDFSAAVTDAIEVSVAGDPNDVVLVEITTPDNLLVITPGDELELTGRLLNAEGAEVSVDVINLIWSSSNSEVATITQKGVVTAIADGEVRITVISGNASGFIDLMVASATSLIRTAEFKGLSGYEVSGDAVLEVGSNGKITLKISSNFMSQNGPGLYVYLSDNGGSITGGVELGKLKSIAGSQEYDVPFNVTLNRYDHIVLYCKPFGVGFGTAKLSD